MNNAAPSALVQSTQFCTMTAPKIPLQHQPLGDDATWRTLAGLEQQTAANPGAVQFQWAKFDRPPHGSCIVVMLSAQQLKELPSDGYVWQDPETMRRVSLGPGKELEIYSREQGVALGQAFVSMRRRRYRIVGGKTNLQVLHYLAVDPRAPRIPALAMAQQYSKMPGDAWKAREEEEQEEDMLANLTESHLASVRYKRNHEFMDELFSPQTTAHLSALHDTPAAAEARHAQRQEYMRKQQVATSDMDTLKHKHHEKIAAWEQRAAAQQAFLDALEGSMPKTEAELTRLQEDYEREFGVRIVPAPIVTVVRADEAMTAEN